MNVNVGSDTLFKVGQHPPGAGGGELVSVISQAVVYSFVFMLGRPQQADKPTDDSARGSWPRREKSASDAPNRRHGVGW